MTLKSKRMRVIPNKRNKKGNTKPKRNLASRLCDLGYGYCIDMNLVDLRVNKADSAAWIVSLDESDPCWELFTYDSDPDI